MSDMEKVESDSTAAAPVPEKRELQKVSHARERRAFSLAVEMAGGPPAIKGPPVLYGIDLMRDALGAMNGCRESFIQRFSVTELLAIRAAWVESAWDFYPDTWTEQQVQDAIRGFIPEWNDDESPFVPQQEKEQEQS